MKRTAVLLSVLVVVAAVWMAQAHARHRSASLADETSDGIHGEFTHLYLTGNTASEAYAILDPVIAGTGELRHQETDFEVPSRGFPFRFTRVYRSLLSYNGPMGHNWDFNYNQHITFYAVDEETNQVSFYSGAGRSGTYNVSADPEEYHPDDPTITDVILQVDPVNPEAQDIIRQTASGFKYHYEYVDQNPASYYNYRLSKIEDRFGNEMTFAYSAGRLSVITDTEGRSYYLFYHSSQGYLEYLSDDAIISSGRTIRFDHDTNGNLVSVVEFPGDPNLERTTNYTYKTGTHLLETAEAPREAADVTLQTPYLTNTYDTNNRVLTQQSGGGTSSIKYHLSGGNVTSIWVFDRVGNRTDHIFDTQTGAVTTLLQYEGSTTYKTKFGYDNLGRLSTLYFPVEVQDPEITGRKKHFYYVTDTHPHARGRLSSITLKPSDTANGETDLVWTYSHYDTTWNIPGRVLDPDNYLTLTTVNSHAGGHTITRTFGKNGSSTQATTTTELDTNGRVIETENAENESTYIEYVGTSGRVWKITNDADLTIPLVTMTYDAYGNIATRTDSRGKTTTYTHDQRNNLTDIYYPGTESYHAQFVHDENDRVIERIVPVRTGVTRKETLTRDILGNVTKVVVERTGPSDTVQTETFLDAEERVWKVVDEEGRVTTLAWTERNLLKEVTFAPGTTDEGTIKYEYDAEGRRTKTTDPLNKDWVVSYDGHGRVLKSTDPSSHYAPCVRVVVA